MKKILILIACLLLIAAPALATDYYACQDAQNINGDATWCTLAHRTGSCAGDGTYTAGATVLQAGNNLYANGCTVAVNVSFTADKISTEAGDGTAGGRFTVSTSTSPLTLTTNFATGSTSCLVISGSANANPALTLMGNGTGSATTGNVYAVSDNHTVGTVVVGSTGSPATFTGGTSGTGSSHGYFLYNSGPVTFNGGGVANQANGIQTASGTITVNGDCTGSNVANSNGCYSYSGAQITLTGNIIDGTRSPGISGKYVWAPATAKKYHKTNGGGTAVYASAGLGSDSDGTKITAANTAAEIKTSAYFVKKDDGVYTQGTASTSGGGGAWGF